MNGLCSKRDVMTRDRDLHDSPIKNLFESIPVELPDELTETLLQTKALRMERIVSRGHHSPAGDWYNQSEHEWVALLTGQATLEFQDPVERVSLAKGDFINIPAFRKHRVVVTDPHVDTIWLAVFYCDPPN